MDECDYRILSEDEYTARWEPIRRRIFVEKPGAAYDFPFLEHSWEVVAIPDYPVYGCAPRSWLNYGDRGIPQNYDEFECLFATLRERGVKEMIVRAYWGGEPSAAIHPYRRAVRHALSNGAVGTLPPVSYFSAEGDWGLQTFWEEVSVLAGTPDFMECFYRHAGGREAKKQRFIEYDISAAWALAHYQSGATEADGYPYNDKPRKAFYDMIGWDMPAYDLE